MITIVIPAFNAARYLQNTLDSVCSQTVTDWEAIVVDDGSTDATLSLAQQYAAHDARIRVVKQRNSGPSTARNHGAKLAAAEASEIIFLDADDIWEPDALEILKSSLDRNPDAIAAYGLAGEADESGKLLNSEFYETHQRRRYAVKGRKVVKLAPEEPTTFACEIVTEMVITCGTVLLRKSVFDSSTGWAEDIALWEDWDLWLRLTRSGGFTLVDRLVLTKRQHDSNLSKDFEKVAAAEREVRARLIKSLSSSDSELHRQAIIGSEYHHRRLITDALLWAGRSLLQGGIRSAASSALRVFKLIRQGAVT